MPFRQRGTGNYSKMMVQATAYAESLQAAALDSIRDQFGMTELLDIMDRGGVSYDQVMRAMIEAEKNGTRAEFEAMLGRQMIQMLDAQAAQAQAAQQPGQAQ